MDKIYLVIGGEYSDWYIEGYFTDKKEAEKYCAIQNNKNSTEYQDFASLYVIETGNLTNRLTNKAVKLSYTHTVVFDKIKNSWIMRNSPNNYSFELYKNDMTNIKSRTAIKDGRKIYKMPWISVSITLPNDERERKKFEKIAQDELYRYLAFDEIF